MFLPDLGILSGTCLDALPCLSVRVFLFLLFLTLFVLSCLVVGLLSVEGSFFFLHRNCREKGSRSYE